MKWTLSLISTPLWEHFQIFELTKVMRQKQLDFIKALNNLANNSLDERDIEIFKSREIAEKDVPIEAIRLFCENRYVEIYNNFKIDRQSGEEFIAEAEDVILGSISEKKKLGILQSLKNKKLSDVNGLPHVVRLKIGLKVTCLSGLYILGKF
ncbi:uncharacterized protein LOC143921538 [Arctopsyche grandis]|uniref:uncharacterized protein LOC143921538 n=1 Tax=Arctopsyche grandis TaxID=121162 RepID=UPI00406D8E29